MSDCKSCGDVCVCRVRIEKLERERDSLSLKADMTEQMRLRDNAYLIEQRDAARAEVERLRGLLDQNETEAHRLIRWRREAEAEVERLRDLFAAEQKATHAALTRDADQIERLREALRDLEEACRDVASWSEECVDYSHPARVKARAALAGSPVETRTEPTERIARRIESLLSTPCATPDFLEGVRRAAERVRVGSLTTVVDSGHDAARLRREQDRALAERQRAACAEYLKHWTYDEHTSSRVRATPLVTEEKP